VADRWRAVRTADLRFTLSQLERIDRGEIESPLSGRLDTTRAAVAGHSRGGAAAIHAGMADHRFRAVIDLDGFPGDRGFSGYPQPLLAVVAGAGTGDAENDKRYAERLTQVLDLSAAPSYRLTVPGAAHLSFTDAPLYLPPVPSFFGSLGRESGPAITAGATLAFLDATLRDPQSTGTTAATSLARFGAVTSFGD
jgi:predicted dienelactone hydrolase